MNLAAAIHVDRSIGRPAAFIETNVVGTFTLLQEALHHWHRLDATARSFLHVSSDEVYGSLGDDGAFSELTPYAPNSPYSASKASSDHLVRAWQKTYGLPTLITNCCNNYGPFHFPEKLFRTSSSEASPKSRFRSTETDKTCVTGSTWKTMRGRWPWWRSAAPRERPTTLELAPNARTWMWSRAFASCSTRCSPQAAARASSSSPSSLIGPGHDRRYAIDPFKIERELGWRAEHDFESRLAKTVRWYLDHQGWWRAILKRGYTTKRVGLGRVKLNRDPLRFEALLSSSRNRKYAG